MTLEEYVNSIEDIFLLRYENEWGAFEYVFKISCKGCVANCFSNITFGFKRGHVNIKKAIKDKDFFDNIIVGAFNSMKEYFGE